MQPSSWLNKTAVLCSKLRICVQIMPYPDHSYNINESQESKIENSAVGGNSKLSTLFKFDEENKFSLLFHRSQLSPRLNVLY